MAPKYSGQGDAFGVLYDLHRDRVFRHAYRLCGNHHDAEDIMAASFLELWRRRKFFLRCWLRPRLHVDGVFSDALRTQLSARFERAASARTRKRTRLWAGTAVFAGIGVLADVGTPQDWSGYTIPLKAGDEGITITTSPEASWKLTAQYVNTKITDWAVNANGDTYGAENENGRPDLVAVMATKGTLGYAYRTDLEDANGTTASKTFKSPADALAWQEAIKGKSFVVPVYDSTGEAVVGEFVISAAGGTSGVRGEPAGECVGIPPTLDPGETYPCPGLSPIETGHPARPVPPN